MVFIRSLHAGRGDGLDRLITHVDERDIVLIKGFVVPLFERRSLGTKGMWRCQLVGDGRVVDARAGLVAPQVLSQPIRGFIDENVAECTRPEVETAVLPRRLEHRVALLHADFECRARVANDVCDAPFEAFRFSKCSG